MHIVLLSGGHGERLWPLSSPKKPKQFLTVFDGIEGKKESMLQRTYRMFGDVRSDIDVTVAIGAGQAELVYSQLGVVSVCEEPTSRDTYAAIALVVAYLHDEKGARDSDCVAICPIDAYAGEGFYEAILDIESEVMKKDDGITLLGVRPSSPSEKYGYIIPPDGDDVSDVRCFREKPRREDAEKYVKDGGIWNAGVFAFRLGYVLEKVKGDIGFLGYNDLLKMYDNIPKISFDRAVLEKEKNLRVVKFSGEWTDVGTWADLFNFLSCKTGANVTFDGQSEGCVVINELGVPVYCAGLKDTLIVLTKDGVLISDMRDASDDGAEIKNYADKIVKEHYDD